MTEHGCGSELHRRHEEMILTNKLMLDEFILRYDRDRAECAARYKEDRDQARIWREAFDKKLEGIEAFLIEMKPNYKAGLYFTGAIVTGALALIFKMIWASVTTRP